MYIRPIHVTKGGKRHAYWALVESYRSQRGPRQRVVAYLGQAHEAARHGIKLAANGQGHSYQRQLFGNVEPEWVEVDAERIRVERCLEFGAPWLAQQLLDRLGLRSVLADLMPEGREEVPWALVVWVLVIARFCDPSSELYIAEHFYQRSALCDLLGIPPEKINEDRLYRALDQLLVHKQALEKHLKQRAGELFGLDYDVLLYDVTSTYFEGLAQGNALAQYGYSRDKRSDCKQVCIALVVNKEGFPLGYEVLAGNRHDSTTVEEIVETVESKYGQANRIWVTCLPPACPACRQAGGRQGRQVDRGMVSEENIEFLREGHRRYILGTPKATLKRFEQELLKKDWQQVHDGLEVKICASADGQETFILCRSQDRRQKEQAMHERFEKRLEAGLKKLEDSCRQRKHQATVVAQRVGRLLERNSRGAGQFKVQVVQEADGRAKLSWEKVEAWRDWAGLSEGCYLLRSNITDWSGEELWKAYIQLTEAEAAFRIHKSDLRIRPGALWAGTRKRIGSRRTSWCASWRTCCGRPWVGPVMRRVWVTSLGG